MTNNQREYFRIALQIPLSAQLKIIGINKSSVETKFTQIFVVDISAGGLCIHSKLDLPLNMDLLLEFNFSLFDKQMKVIGTVTRKTILDSKLFEYGIQFFIDETLHKELLGKLNLLNIRLRQTNVISNCSFCSEEEMKQFYSS